MVISKMVPHVIFSIIHLFFVVIQFNSAAPARVRWVDTLPTLTHPSPEFVKSVVVDRIHTGDVFVGGINVLYHLSSELELKQNVSIGPVDDYPGCPAPPYPCGRRRVPMDNTARSVQLVYDLARSPCLLLCGSVYRSLCQVRPLDNLTEYHWVHPYNESLGYTTNGELNYALMERGFGGQTSLFTAAYITYPMSPFSAPFLSSKVLKSNGDRYYFQPAFQNDSFSNAVTLKNTNERIPIDGGFLHEDYIYFPTLISTGNSTTTRLVRFCSTDPTFRSYQELPVQCNRRDKIVKRLTAAHLGPSTGYDGTKKSLYMSFNDDRSGSAMCVSDMSKVVTAFETWPRVCNRDVTGERCDDESERIVDFCGSYPMFYDGKPFVVNRTLEADSLFYIQNLTIVAVTVMKQYGEVIALVGDRSGLIIKISMVTGQILNGKDALDRNTAGAFVSPFVFDREEKHIYLIIRNKVIKYPVESCGVYETCHDCFVRGRKNDPLKCGWCAGRCVREEECADSFSTDTCTPTIYEVFPKKGPIQGGNTVTITGDSFGSYVDDAHTSISVAGIQCTSPSWSNYQINCTLGSTTEELSGPVEVKVSNALSNGYKIEGLSVSETNFSYYVGFRLYGIDPRKGPTSGGTLVTLYGEDLGQEVKDKKCMVSVYGRLCILQRFDKNSVACIIQNSTDPRFSKASIAIHVDGVAYLMDENPPSTFSIKGISQTYEFTPDPQINYIRPGITTLSGLMNLTAFGRYLDSVQFPKLVLKLPETQIIGESEKVEDCWTDPKSNGTRMTCRTPSLKDSAIFPPATRTHPFIAQVSFLMDGVKRLRDFPKHREDISRLLYYPDPEFDVFHELEKVKKDQKLFEIKGKYLDLMHLADNLQVRIGSNDTCKISSVSSDNLFCELPLSLTMSSSKTNMSIEVYVGTKIYLLGYIDIEENDEGISIWVYLLVLAVIAICLLAMFLYCRRVHGKNPITNSEMVLRIASPNDYRHVPTRTFVSQKVHDERTRKRETSTAIDEIPHVVDKETLFKFANKNLIISKRHLKISEIELGSGEFGCVYEGSLCRPNEIEQTKVAVKVLHQHSWDDPKKVNKFLNEALLMLDFDHLNVVGLYGVCLANSGPSIVLPFMCKGSLLEYMRDERRDMIVSELMKFAVDVAAGMEYLEANKSLHRDLAARNVLLDEDRTAKVSDFGLSRDVYVSDYYETEKGSKTKIPVKWTAPEALKDQKYSNKSDVWSYGVLLWELMTRGFPPYNDIHNFDMPEYLFKGYRLKKPEHCPMPVYKVMLACWNLNSKIRPSFDELHEYVSFLHQDLLRNERAVPQPEAVYVPAQHSIYHDTRELYLSMEGKPLQRETESD